MGLNTNGNAPHKFKGIHLGKAIDRGLYYGLQFSKNRESKRYHSLLYDVALRQLEDNQNERDFKRHQGDLQHAENLLNIQAQNNANQGELNLKQKEQLMKLYQYAKKNGLDTSQLEDALKNGADVDMSKMDNTKEWNEAYGTWKANNKEAGGATPNNSPPESNHTVGDNTNPQPDNPNDNKEPFNETDTPDNPTGETSPNASQPDLETKENNPLYNWWNKHFSKQGGEAHSKQYYKDATQELSGKNSDLTDKNNQLEEGNKQLTEDLSNKTKEAEYHQNMEEVNKSGMDDAVNQAQKQAEEKRDLQGAIDDKQNTINSKDAKIDELNKQAEQTKEDSQRAWDNNRQFVNQLTDERSNLSNENKSLKSDKENLTNENQYLKSDNENVNKQLQDKDQDIKDHDKFMEERMANRDKQNAKDLEIAKSETARAQAKADKIKEGMSHTIDKQNRAHQEQLANIGQKNAKLNDRNKGLETSNKQLSTDNSNLKQQVNIKDKLLGNQNKANVNLEKNNQKLTDTNAKQKANYENEIQKRDTKYAKDIEASKGETSRAQFKLGQANAKNEKLTAQNKQLSGDNKHLHSLFSGLSKIGKKGGGGNGSDTNQ